MRSIKKYFFNPRLIGLALIRRLSPLFSDKTFLKIVYRLEVRQRLNLRCPERFTEKIQWLKLNNRKSEFTNMVDKFNVKEFVAKKIGKEYIIPTIGLWESPDQIDFDLLPDKFVLKTTHGGGGGATIICNNKTTLDKAGVVIKLQQCMTTDIFKNYREWPYKNVDRRIIAEKLLLTKDGDLKDYKFFCFNGEPKFLKVDFDRYSDHHANYYDLYWNLLPFGEATYPPIKSHIEECPPNFQKMIEVARILSNGHIFIRVDLYNVEGKIYFGELTFYPASGMGAFTPDEYDKIIGDLLRLPNTLNK